MTTFSTIFRTKYAKKVSRLSGQETLRMKLFVFYSWISGIVIGNVCRASGLNLKIFATAIIESP